MTLLRHDPKITIDILNKLIDELIFYGYTISYDIKKEIYNIIFWYTYTRDCVVPLLIEILPILNARVVPILIEILYMLVTV
jgi:hypothetical protein